MSVLHLYLLITILFLVSKILAFDTSQIYIEYETGVRALPHNLVPEIPSAGPQQTCPNGFTWDERDPVKAKWKTGRATIYKQGLSVKSVSIDGHPHDIEGESY